MRRENWIVPFCSLFAAPFFAQQQFIQEVKALCPTAKGHALYAPDEAHFSRSAHREAGQP